VNPSDVGIDDTNVCIGTNAARRCASDAVYRERYTATFGRGIMDGSIEDGDTNAAELAVACVYRTPAKVE
jgi:hypothetical protein